VTGPATITLHVGDVQAAPAPTVIKTVLGSCVAVCLWDPQLRLGGMNHFLLPRAPDSRTIADDAARFGVHAMDRLIGEMLKHGSAPRRWIVKVFGGASVLALGARGRAIPQANVAFVEAFLAREGYTITARSVGGTVPRRVHFHTDTGRVLVRRLLDPRARTAVATRERQLPPPKDGDVTLF
jgi:chemotaxis protein CheD